MKLLDVSDKLLGVMAWPIVKLEQRFISDDLKAQHGEVPDKERRGAAVERWGIFAIGAYSGTLMSSFPAVTTIFMAAISLSFVSAMFIDPFLWARKKTFEMVEAADFTLGVVVNLAPLWMSWVGFAIGIIAAGAWS